MTPPPNLTFPHRTELARGREVVAVTGDEALTVENLRAAYAHGIFPWPGRPEEPIPWACPRRRAVLGFAEFTPGRTLEKTARQPGWSFSIDRDFPAVIAACAAAPRPGQAGTWISPAMIAAYTALHRAGAAHSVEVWKNDALVGGLYGVDAGGFFGGESMFHLEANASKLAIWFLAGYLRERGQAWLDIQQLTPHMERLGAKEITRATFLAELENELSAGRTLFPKP